MPAVYVVCMYKTLSPEVNKLQKEKRATVTIYTEEKEEKKNI